MDSIALVSCLPSKLNPSNLQFILNLFKLSTSHKFKTTIDLALNFSYA